MALRNLQELYRTSFSSESYIELLRVAPDWQDFYLKNTFEVLSKGLASGKRFLEFGIGPTIHHSVLLSKFCETIVVSDFTESNRDLVKLWWKEDSKIFDQLPYLKQLAEIEGFSNLDEGVSEIKNRLRNKLQDVVFCDATQEYPLEKKVEPFDLIFSSLCLESASLTSEDFISAVKNVSNLLKPKGTFILVGIINCNWYVVGNTKFSCASLNEELIKKALTLAGFTVNIYKEKTGEDDVDEFCDSRKIFFSSSAKH